MDARQIAMATALVGMAACAGCTLQIGTGSDHESATEESEAEDADQEDQGAPLDDGDEGPDGDLVDGGGGAGGSDPADDECTCEPGSAQWCACDDGSLGTQSCVADCTSYSECTCQAPLLPSTVTIQVVDALVAPFKTDRSTWDGDASYDASAASDLATALSAIDPYAAAVAYVAYFANAGWEAPDPFGIFSVWDSSTGQWLSGNLATVDDNFEDTFHPTFPGGDYFVHVPLEPDVRISVSLVDEDWSYNDPIATAQVGYDDIVAALYAGDVYQVKVADQTQQQLLFLGISVIGE